MAQEDSDDFDIADADRIPEIRELFIAAVIEAIARNQDNGTN